MNNTNCADEPVARSTMPMPRTVCCTLTPFMCRTPVWVNNCDDLLFAKKSVPDVGLMAEVIQHVNGHD